MFSETYITKKCTISNVDELNKQIEKELKTNLKGIIARYFSIKDEDAV